MRHRKHTFKVGRSPSHRHAMLANLASSLILEGRILTTVTKAKETRRLAERMITLGKQGDLNARRRAIAVLHHQAAVRELFGKVAPRFAGRPGGYTRILKIGQRRGDAAEVCYLELVEVSAAAPTGAGEAAAAAAQTSAPAAEPAKS